MSGERAKDHLAIIFKEYQKRTGETVFERNTRRIAERVKQTPTSDPERIAEDAEEDSFWEAAQKSGIKSKKPTDNK